MLRNLFLVMFLALLIGGCTKNNTSQTKNAPSILTPTLTVQLLAVGKMAAFSVDSVRNEKSPLTSKAEFHGYRIKSLHKVETYQEHQMLLGLLFSAIKAKGGGAPSSCKIQPSYAYRVTKGEEVYDFLIGFDCNQYQLFRMSADGKRIISEESGDFKGNFSNLLEPLFKS